MFWVATSCARELKWARRPELMEIGLRSEVLEVGRRAESQREDFRRAGLGWRIWVATSFVRGRVPRIGAVRRGESLLWETVLL